jgi:hypothetical protein
LAPLVKLFIFLSELAIFPISIEKAAVKVLGNVVGHNLVSSIEASVYGSSTNSGPSSGWLLNCNVTEMIFELLKQISIFSEPTNEDYDL